jgi:Phage integrase family
VGDATRRLEALPRNNIAGPRLTGFRFHDLRRTYAALMVAAGAHPKYLQAQMGYSSIRFTLDLYGHLFPDTGRGVLDALAALTDPSTPHRKTALRNRSTKRSPLPGTSTTGATGLEPATSGVTGRS